VADPARRSELCADLTEKPPHGGRIVPALLQLRERRDAALDSPGYLWTIGAGGEGGLAAWRQVVVAAHAGMGLAEARQHEKGIAAVAVADAHIEVAARTTVDVAFEAVVAGAAAGKPTGHALGARRNILIVSVLNFAVRNVTYEDEQEGFATPRTVSWRVGSWHSCAPIPLRRQLTYNSCTRLLTLLIRVFLDQRIDLTLQAHTGLVHVLTRQLGKDHIANSLPQLRVGRQFARLLPGRCS